MNMEKRLNMKTPATSKLSISRKAITLIIFLALTASIPAFSQIEQYDIKAVLISKIAKYIDWPPETQSKSEYFTIGVIGENPFGEALELAFENREIKNKKVVVKYFRDVERFNHCDVVFISSSGKDSLDKILPRLRGKSILTIGDTKGFGEKGVLINFYIRNNKIRFELNESAAKAEGFRIDYRLRNIAKIIDRKSGG